MKTTLVLLALVAAPFAASASVVMAPAPIAVPETPNEEAPEAQETPTPEDNAPLAPLPDTEAEPQVDQELMLLPPLIDAGEDVITAPPGGPLDAGRL